MANAFYTLFAVRHFFIISLLFRCCLRTGDEVIFSQNKILLAKMRRTYCCTLFVVCRQFSHGRRFFLTEKYFAFVDETATLTQILHTAYGKKPIRETWRTPFIHYSPYVVFSLFCPCFTVVRE